MLRALLSAGRRLSFPASVSIGPAEAILTTTVSFVGKALPLPPFAKADATISSDIEKIGSKCSSLVGYAGAERHIFVGLGDDRIISMDAVRKATEKAVEELRKLDVTGANVVIPQLPGIEADVVGQSVVQTFLQANYSFEEHIVNESKSLDTLNFIPPADSYMDRENISKLAMVLESVYMAKDWVNGRSEQVSPASLEKIATDIAEKVGLTCTVLQQPELAEKGFGLLCAVGRAATVPPRLVVLEWPGVGKKASEPPIALVGKGITFDSGGLNLKPTGFIEDMHSDMAGSAAVLATMRAAAMTGVNRRVIGVLALAENAIGPDSVKPRAIVCSLKGDTVQIENTDAEGRLALADAMWYVQDEYSPAVLVDVATLTGACVVALGEKLAGVFGNDTKLIESLCAVGKDIGDVCWPMPITKEHEEELKPAGRHADLLSCGKDRWGGACTAAAFLKQFVQKDIGWAHLDIAGPGYSQEKGASGFGVQLLTSWLHRQ